MKRRLYKLYAFLLNNVVFNNLMLLLGLEKKLIAYKHHYRGHQAAPEKSLQEIAGFSLRPEINAYLEKAHADLKSVTDTLEAGSTILEIGCGPGLYLKDIDSSRYQVHALDMSEAMITLAQRENPGCTFYQTGFLDLSTDKRFDLIYSVGVLMYFPKSQIREVFKKIHGLLNKGGLVFINYPHAISRLDLLYPDSKYVQYSPEFIENICMPDFKIVRHHHAFDGRTIKKFDERPYQSLNPATTRTYKNSYLVVLQKK